MVLRGLQHARVGETISLGKTTDSWPWASLPPPSSALGSLHTYEGLELEAWLGRGREAALDKESLSLS